REPRRRRRLRPLPAPAGRAPRGELLLGAVAGPPPRGPVRGLRRPARDRARAQPAAGVPRELLRLDRGRREARAPLRRRVRRPHRALLARLPAPRLEVPARGRALPHPTAARRDEAADPLGQLRAPLRDRGLMARRRGTLAAREARSEVYRRLAIEAGQAAVPERRLVPAARPGRAHEARGPPRARHQPSPREPA